MQGSELLKIILFFQYSVTWSNQIYDSFWDDTNFLDFYIIGSWIYDWTVFDWSIFNNC